MRIQKIKLKNFRQHADREIDVTGNLIGIVGPNGSGKSNFLKGIQFGLVGDVPDVNKEKLLRWGESDGYVELHLDDKFILKRSVSNTDTILTTTDGSVKKTTGITSVNRVLKEVFGLDKELAKQTIFVRQAEIDAVLFETPAKREQAFQKLCGMGTIAASVHKKSGEIISEKFKEPPDYTDQIQQVTDQRDMEISRLDALQQELITDNLVIDEEELTQLKTSLPEINNVLGKLKMLEMTCNEVSSLADQVSACKAELSRLEVVKQEDIDVLITSKNEAQSLLKDIKSYEVEAAKLTCLLQDKAKLGSAPVTDADLEKIKDMYEALVAKYQTAKARREMLTGIYDAVVNQTDSISVCPICHSDIKDPKSVQARLKKDIEANTVSKPTEAERLFQEKQAALKTYNAKLLTTNTMLATLTKQVEALREQGLGDVDVTGISAEISGLAEAITLKQSTLRTYTDAVTRLDVLNGAYKRKVEQCTSATTTLYDMITRMKEVTVGYDDLTIENSTEISNAIIRLTTDYEAVTKRIEIATGKLRARGIRDGTITELTKSIAAKVKAVEELNSRKAASNNYDAVVKTLTNVRDWFHYRNGPRALSSCIINDMLGGINNFLTIFDAPFTVIPKVDEGLEFSCIFSDGRNTSTDVSAEDLSGGEKILLATSFRLASYCMFAQELGLLSLDEPTVYLDEKNVAKFCLFLSRVKEIITGLDLQILIATHERTVIPYLDTVIDLQ